MGAKQSAELRKALRLMAKAEAAGQKMTRAEAARQAGVSPSTITKHFNKINRESNK